MRPAGLYNPCEQYIYIAHAPSIPRYHASKTASTGDQSVTPTLRQSHALVSQATQLHAAQLLSDDELDALQTQVADYLELRCSAGRVVTVAMTHVDEVEKAAQAGRALGGHCSWPCV